MNDMVLQDLQGAGLKRVEAKEPMSRHTSWRIGGPADYLCVVETEEQLRSAVDVAVQHGLPWLVLGGGNNVLVSDQGIAGIVILNRLRGIEIITNGNGPEVDCGAGVFFARVAQFTAQKGFTGMEWGVSIPGTVGAGVVNNAGAHWSDVSRTLHSARILDAGGRQQVLDAEALAYQYRHSALKLTHVEQTPLVVTGCRFRLKPDDPAAALARIEEMRQHRLRTQPIKEASAGSTFTNPPGEHAGALIDRAGLKGHRVGGAQIAPLHANFILNQGGARAADVVALISLARERVLDRFGIRLVPEVQFVGRWDEGEVAALTGEQP